MGLRTTRLMSAPQKGQRPMQKKFRSSTQRAIPTRVVPVGSRRGVGNGRRCAGRGCSGYVDRRPPATEAVSPFSISLPQTAIDDLRHRLDSNGTPSARRSVTGRRVCLSTRPEHSSNTGGIGMTGGASKRAQTRFRISARESTGLVFTSSTHDPRMPTPCPSSLRTGGPARSWSSWRSLVRSPNQRGLVGR